MFTSTLLITYFKQKFVFYSDSPISLTMPKVCSTQVSRAVEIGGVGVLRKCYSIVDAYINTPGLKH